MQSIFGNPAHQPLPFPKNSQNNPTKKMIEMKTQ